LVSSNGLHRLVDYGVDVDRPCSSYLRLVSLQPAFVVVED
jgi:hypothetical protein